jgi:hypothetical protein
MFLRAGELEDRRKIAAWEAKLAAIQKLKGET